MAVYKGARASEEKSWMDEVVGLDLDVVAAQVLGAMAGANYTVVPKTPDIGFLTAA